MSTAAIFGLSGLTLTEAERDFFRSADPWGFILFAHNVESPDQLRRLTGDLRDAVGRDAVITVDQEGGRVQRLRAPHWTDWDAPLNEGRRGPRAIWLRYRLIGAELRACGIDSNCAPTLDVAQADTHPFLRDRCLGDDASEVSMLGRAAADGMLAAGVLPVVKHMPGHGRARADSHKDLPVVDAPETALNDSDFVPFRALKDAPLGMTAHIRYAALDDAPATISAPMIELIRKRIGFQGLLMTDDLGMEALPGNQVQRTAAAIAAGCDLALACHGDLPEKEAITAAAGQMSVAALARSARALKLREDAQDDDIAALRAEYMGLRGMV
ncbi:MAG: glycoside hydrolase family 3 N-terminal domain-containing protein [Paracoccus sp. (in: a-proteobacteria)]|uniref:glycoside hydrolase family 3 N-terminal domain-containing protein n=1 Tax=Paracoccus sp. TaxID=267 RepID=UPI0026DED40D|nr:glycoside hydrolase family 3 N-terminal domain-containing protein [Paracoccus sp. (in: a-proteobacteria)]MDO5621099.1 glycoside hydrolase family 3 N-terminal domain-containing protein [Paracoccus sp. (in: a-proteobacteria)]